MNFKAIADEIEDMPLDDLYDLREDLEALIRAIDTNIYARLHEQGTLGTLSYIEVIVPRGELPTKVLETLTKGFKKGYWRIDANEALKSYNNKTGEMVIEFSDIDKAQSANRLLSMYYHTRLVESP